MVQYRSFRTLHYSGNQDNPFQHGGFIFPSKTHTVEALHNQYPAMTTALAPLLFVSHGAPTFAIEPGKLGPQLHTLGTELGAIKAVLVVSPHWQTRGVAVSTAAAPETIHDFGGFPAALYDMQYPAPGAPEVAAQAAKLLADAGFATSISPQRGLDHGAWVPMYHLLPDAKIPVFQVSMPYDLSAEQALQMGRALAPLREQGVLILASGSMTHNLREFRRHSATAPYVEEFANWIRTAVKANAVQAMVHYRSEAPHAERAHPSEEHFLPLLVALGAQKDGDTARLLDGGIEHGVLSMDSYVWGLPQ
jgi:4,5-DOPA dioxygenase extradiol